MFKKILIANRGEIAVRIVRTCRDMGIDTVAVYVPQDRESLHVRLADEATALASPLRYGDPDEILAIARQTGADAIHPGYGFLAEEPDFVERCVREGIAFIGPPAPVIQTLKDKMEALDTVKRAGYCVPLYAELPDTDDPAQLQRVAADVGYPLVVKSARGGRGRGARVVMKPDRLAEAVRAARHEAKMIYDNDRLYLERVIAPSHYLAVQVLADSHGNTLHLGEREGSLLRHNQKLIEESPASCLEQSQREALWAMALDIARLFHFQGVGSVEFLLDSAGNFHFTEIKSRIQIEHPVSEMISDVDIVAEQIRIAAGEPLSVTQEGIRLNGHAMICRINAEDPWNDYLPSPGELRRFRLPQGPGVRVDTYGYVGCQIPIRYDSLLAKVTVWDDTRGVHRAPPAGTAGVSHRRRADQPAHAPANLAGPGLRRRTPRHRLHGTLPLRQLPRVGRGTQGRGGHRRRGLPAAHPHGQTGGAGATAVRLASLGTPASGVTGESIMNRLNVTIDGQNFDVVVHPSRSTPDEFVVKVDGVELHVTVPNPDDPASIDWMLVDDRPYEIIAEPELHFIQTASGRHAVQVRDLETRTARPTSGDGRVKAPIPGLVTRLRVGPGQAVQAGDSLVVLEAMKMENDIRAGTSGVVKTVHVVPGQSVTLNEVLLEIE